MTMSVGPRNQWNSPERSTPVASSPNQMNIIHLAIVVSDSPVRPTWLSLSHHIDKRNPPKHQAARAVRNMKSDIIARSEMKSMFSGIKQNASRGSKTGAAREILVAMSQQVLKNDSSWQYTYISFASFA